MDKGVHVSITTNTTFDLAERCTLQPLPVAEDGRKRMSLNISFARDMLIFVK